MSQILNELATIEVSNETLQRLDIGNIYQNFRNSYRKLDDLKNFRTDYEKQNAVMRYWHNDKLRDAQLDSAEVQAEFSKTIGQLMMLSIMQSKKLYEQQTQLNEQQGKLKSQADGIAKHAGELQIQHRRLAEQSEKLETVVVDYFKSKGIDEEDVQKLINIVSEVEITKDEMLQEFAVRTKDVEALCSEVAAQMDSLSANVNDQFQLNAQQTLATVKTIQQELRQTLTDSENAMLHKFAARTKDVEALCSEVAAQMDSLSANVNDQFQLNAQQTLATIKTMQRELRQALADSKTSIRHEHDLAQHSSNQSILALEQRQREAGVDQIHKWNELDAKFDTQAIRMTEVAKGLSAQKTELTIRTQQQGDIQAEQALFKKAISVRLNHLVLISACVSAASLISLGGMAYLLRWI